MINNWTSVASGSYSMWAFYLIIISQAGMQAFATLSPEMAPSPMVNAIVMIVLGAVGAIGRVLAQPNLGEEE